MTAPATSFDSLIAAAREHVRAERWEAAIDALQRAVAARPLADAAWRALGDARREARDPVGASAAHGEAVRLALAGSPLREAVAAMAGRQWAVAETIVRARLSQAPSDVAAIGLLAELALRAGNVADAVRFLRRALELAPEHEPARRDLARALYDNRDLPEALAEFDRLLASHPDHPGYRNLRAATLDLLGDHEGAISAYRAMLAADPAQPLVWMTLGNVLKTTGDIPGAVAAFRRSLALAPDTGEAWWGLANLKSFRFGDAEIASLQAALARPDVIGTDRVCIDFALGKAMEDRAQFAESFAHYSAGNRRQRAHAPHDPEQLGGLARRCEALFTPAFFAARAGWGEPAADPIFIVGMPRSGSTLVEQILASHPAVEGTAELPELPRLTRLLGGAGDPATAAYPDSLSQLSRGQVAALGAEYLRRAARWRRTQRPFFIDKLPLNFMSVGLIRLALPNARIVDVRRHPLGCGLSIFKQYFPKGSGFSMTQEHIGRHYADYVRMMAMWEARLPGQVHRVVYEHLVADTEREVRRLLAFLGLPFDPACLDFHANHRAVRTPSAEQVRRPMYTDAVEHWRHYAPWLGPLAEALGDVLTCYPDPP